MEGADLPFVREELDDDDRTRERQRYRDIETRQPGQPQSQADQEPHQGCEQHLPQSRRHGHSPHGADQPDVELEAHKEQQDGDAQLSEQVDGLATRGNPQRRRARNESHHDVADDQGLTEGQAQESHTGSQHQERGDLVEEGEGVCEHAGHRTVGIRPRVRTPRSPP